jgi:hypothetical protein
VGAVLAGVFRAAGAWGETPVDDVTLLVMRYRAGASG